MIELHSVAIEFVNPEENSRVGYFTWQNTDVGEPSLIFATEKGFELYDELLEDFITCYLALKQIGFEGLKKVIETSVNNIQQKIIDEKV